MDIIKIIWISLVVVFLVVEAIVPGLISIWFGLGAIVALISSFFGAPIWLQIILFLVVSVIALILTRPLAHKYVNSRVQATNADKVIGENATVTETIDNVAGSGAVNVGGRTWTARSATGEVLEKGSLTVVKTIEGVKLIVQSVK